MRTLDVSGPLLHGGPKYRATGGLGNQAAGRGLPSRMAHLHRRKPLPSAERFSPESTILEYRFRVQRGADLQFVVSYAKGKSQCSFSTMAIPFVPLLFSVPLGTDINSSPPLLIKHCCHSIHIPSPSGQLVIEHQLHQNISVP